MPKKGDGYMVGGVFVFVGEVTVGEVTLKGDAILEINFRHSTSWGNSSTKANKQKNLLNRLCSLLNSS